MENWSQASLRFYRDFETRRCINLPKTIWENIFSVFLCLHLFREAENSTNHHGPSITNNTFCFSTLVQMLFLCLHHQFSASSHINNALEVNVKLKSEQMHDQIMTDIKYYIGCKHFKKTFPPINALRLIKSIAQRTGYLITCLIV